MKPLVNLGYTALNLDRCGVSREQAGFIENLYKADNSTFLPLWQGNSLINNHTGDSPACIGLLNQQQLQQLELDSSRSIFLGVREEQAIFAVDLPTHEHAKDLESIGSFIELRSIVSSLSASDAALLGYARALAHWQNTNRFCSNCGAKQETSQSGHMQKCPQCGHENYPRLNPAIIVLVESQDKNTGEPVCLLGRHKGLAKGAYSTLAGFVEAGESLEEAVIREVFEESGITIIDSTYLGSQPWPFPSSLMIGFRATAEYSEVKIDTNELEDARWFTREEVQAFGNWGSQQTKFSYSRPDSIASSLIKHWLNSFTS